MWEIETDCYIGPDGLAYSNNRKYSRGEWPIVGLYVHPKTGRSVSKRGAKLAVRPLRRVVG